MNQLIPIINKLQDVFATIGSQPIDLPQIAVVGSQSVGKSSVLESIVGKDFLPRGSDIVTRRPLILQLFNTKQPHNDNNLFTDTNIDADAQESKANNNRNNSSTHHQNGKRTQPEMWGEFLHSGNKKYYDFKEIRREIERETERVAPGKAISYQTINLKIFSPNVLNLTLVDLPGMTKVPVGNQPADIERTIRKLLRTFICKPRCLILAISAATSDLATSDAIQLAKEVDPKGVRTLGVMTKIDLMDDGTNCLKALTNKVIPLHLGYVGVINRSQKDINDGRDVQHARNKERMFWKNHAAYRSISDACGVEYLSKKLNQILINHIKAHLPQLRQQINDNIRGLEHELDSYGQPLIADTQNKGATLLQLISKFGDNFNNTIDGSGVVFSELQRNKSSQSSSESTMNRDLSPGARDLYGGARILYIFRTEFQQKLAKIQPFDGLSDQYILNSMRNASGIRSSLFIPEMCFENLVKMQIEKLRRPCMECVDLVFAELRRIVLQCETAEIARFSQFQKALHHCVTVMLQKHVDPCRVAVNQLIDVELAYVNTNHPDFISMDDVFNEQQQQNQQQNNPNYRAQSQAQAQSQQNQRRHSNNNANSNQSSNQMHNNNHNAQANMSRQSQPHQQNANSNNMSNSSSSLSQQNRKNSSNNAPKDSGFGFFGFGKKQQPQQQNKLNKSSSHSSNNNPSASVMNNNPNVNANGGGASHTITNPFHGNDGRQNQNRKRNSLNHKRQSGSNGHGHGHPVQRQSSDANYIGQMYQPLPNATDREQLELIVIKRFIQSYFAIVKKKMADSVPKALMFLLVNKSKQRLQQELALALYKEDQFEQLLSESPEIAQKRKATKEMLQVLQRAIAIINEVRDYNMN